MADEIINNIRPMLDTAITDYYHRYTERLATHIANTLTVDKRMVLDAFSTFNMSDISTAKSNIIRDVLTNTRLPDTPNEIFIITNYSDKAVAIFGDTRSIKDTVLKGICKFNSQLRFGPGWVIAAKKFDELKEKLKSKGIVTVEFTSDEMQKHLSSGGKKNVEISPSPIIEEVDIVKETKPDKSPPKIKRKIYKKSVKYTGMYEIPIGDVIYIAERNHNREYYIIEKIQGNDKIEIDDEDKEIISTSGYQ